jgi:hypothetical protein
LVGTRRFKQIQEDSGTNNSGQAVGTYNSGDSGVGTKGLRQLALIIQEIQAVGTKGLRQLALIIQEIQAVGTNNSGDSGRWH